MTEEQQRFREDFPRLFDAHFHRILRYLDRLSGDPDLAADIAQETFARLYRRGKLPASPEAWLISVAMNLFRNERTTTTRRRRLLTGAPLSWRADPSPAPAIDIDANCTRERVRAALEQLPERERSLLLLRAEGYSYRELGEALQLNQSSVGTLLARARQTFRQAYGGNDD